MSISGALNIAVSGVLSAGARTGNAANNLANVRSVAAPADEVLRPGEEIPETNANGERIFRPTEVQATTAGPAGVQTQTTLVDPASFPIYDPSAADANEDGLSSIPNVSIEQETVNLIGAQRQLEANVAVIRTGDELLEEAIDILA
ncbi:hypothetical protein NUH88_01065 [Nisaea acidiphila]|uniref:Flagellar basal-body/hook protein C-terminal domain-containing protein n=1 Tax=Nisaea acidiphila TaxID=1862145 RepID=A0A9J7ATY4_9PROT|nr:flagellar basal body rod C-terminal domain-containing protein [Nisaea acidiphila]UUX50290.1 hypothetical protein NUH88_01065 [Nisaea acidiphila]